MRGFSHGILYTRFVDCPFVWFRPSCENGCDAREDDGSYRNPHSGSHPVGKRLTGFLPSQPFQVWFCLPSIAEKRRQGRCLSLVLSSMGAGVYERSRCDDASQASGIGRRFVRFRPVHPGSNGCTHLSSLSGDNAGLLSVLPSYGVS